MTRANTERGELKPGFGKYSLKLLLKLSFFLEKITGLMVGGEEIVKFKPISQLSSTALERVSRN